LEAPTQASLFSQSRPVRRAACLLAGAGVLILIPMLYIGWPAREFSAFRSFIKATAGYASQTVDAVPAPLVPAPLVPVHVALVQQEAVPIYLACIGTVQAYNTVSITSRVDGQIAQILFVEGQDVKQGDPLVIIDQRPFQALLDQQLATLQKDQALLAGAVLDMQRYDTLAIKSFATQQQVDQQHALVDQYRAQTSNDQAQINYARTQLEYTTIRAPISGRVGIRQIDQGNFLHASDSKPIVVITQLQPISVIFTLAAAALERTKLTLGRVAASVVAIGQDDRTELDRGTVEVVDNQVDQSTGTIKLRASFPNTEFKLWPGNFVNGRITVDTRPEGLTVPAIALQHGPRGDFVWVVKSDNTVMSVNVTADQVANGRVLIERGLSKDQRVVTSGYYRLENGAKVEIDATAEKPPSAG